jgi:hypothetical protein
MLAFKQVTCCDSFGFIIRMEKKIIQQFLHKTRFSLVQLVIKIIHKLIWCTKKKSHSCIGSSQNCLLNSAGMSVSCDTPNLKNSSGTDVTIEY